MSKKLFLLDGMALIYRAYFAFIRNPMINSKGRNTSALFGFLNTLLEILEKQEPTHIAVAFDVSGPTFRHDEYPEYKAQREDTPEEIRSAIPAVKELLEAFNIPVLTKQGFEADDIIGTLARKAEAEGFDTYMVTPDKDFAQLVDEHPFMMKPAKGGAEAQVLGVKEVLEQWQIEKIEQVIDILGLAGEGADDVIGLEPLFGEHGDVERFEQFLDGGNGGADLFRGVFALGFVFRIFIVAERRAGDIEGDGNVCGLLLFEDFEQRIEEAEEGRGVAPLGVDHRIADECEVSAVDQRHAVE